MATRPRARGMGTGSAPGESQLVRVSHPPAGVAFLSRKKATTLPVMLLKCGPMG